MRTTLAATMALVAAAPAYAHPGHIAPSGGHDHIVVIAAGVVLCLVLAGAAMLMRGRRRDR